jgi:hypothetical protein
MPANAGIQVRKGGEGPLYLIIEQIVPVGLRVFAVAETLETGEVSHLLFFKLEIDRNLIA